MKSSRIVTMLGAIAIFLAAGAASAESTMDLRAARAAAAKAAEIEMEAKRRANFEAALPARLALVNSVIDQYRSEFARDGLDGMRRLSHFAVQVHSTPSNVLQAAGFARTVAEFADQTEKALAIMPKELGGNFDLIFFPMVPCRFADSRFATAGALQNGVVRNYRNFSAIGQGGDAGCNQGSIGVNSGTNGAIAMNIAATSVTGTGNLNVRPVGSTGTTASLNLIAGQDISNATVIKMTGGGATNDFQILPTVNGAPGTVHVVLDLLGFYVTSKPTALECVDTAFTAGTTGTSPGTETSASAPACAAGFTRVSMNCVESNDAIMTDMSVQGGFCSYAPRVAVATGFSVGARCCRVPGNASGQFPGP